MTKKVPEVGARKKPLNKQKLTMELTVIFGVILVVFLVRFLPWLAEQPVPWYNPYEKYQTLLRDVEKYDYSKGKDAKLEKRLENGTAEIGSSQERYYYNLKAKAIYYYNISDHWTSLDALDEAINWALSPDETASVYELYAKNYRAMNAEEKAKEYEELRSAIPT